MTREMVAAQTAIEMQPSLQAYIDVSELNGLVRFRHENMAYAGTDMTILVEMLYSLCSGNRVDLSKTAYLDSHNRTVAVAMLQAYLTAD